MDGESFETTKRELTPNEIIKDFAHKDPATHYLVQIEGHHRESFQGKGDVPIKMHDGMKFQVISTGPTPVSDVDSTGPAAFALGLVDLGYHPEALPGKPDHLVIDYEAQAAQWPMDVRSWERFACQVAGRDLTRSEWSDELPGRPYRHVCPQ